MTFDEYTLLREPPRAYVADYQRLFGGRPDALLGISIMTDSDDTLHRCGDYDFIELGGSAVAALGP